MGFLFFLRNTPRFPVRIHNVRKFNISLNFDCADRASLEQLMQRFIAPGRQLIGDANYEYHGEYAPSQDIITMMNTRVTSILTAPPVNRGYHFFGIGISVNPVNGHNQYGGNIELKFGLFPQIGIPNQDSFAYQNLFVINIHIRDSNYFRNDVSQSFNYFRDTLLLRVIMGIRNHHAIAFNVQPDDYDPNRFSHLPDPDAITNWIALGRPRQ